MKRDRTSHPALPYAFASLLSWGLTSTAAVTDTNSYSGTYFGSSVRREPANEPWPNALARLDATIGPLNAVRVYFKQEQGGPKDWSSPELNHDRALVVSFKLLPNEVVAGTYDSAMRAWFANAPRDRPVWWVYWHEPEAAIQDGVFTAEEYRLAFRHLDALADAAANPSLHTTQVLMDWTLDPRSHRNWRDYYPGADVIDVQAWDQYNYADKTTCVYQTMAEHEAQRPAYAISTAEGNGYAIAEIGADTCIAQRPDWLGKLGDWARGRAAFVTYFNSTVGGDYRLLDPESQAAWRSVSDGTRFQGPPIVTALEPVSVTSTAATLQCDVDPSETSTEFWFTSWRPQPGGAREFTVHAKETLTGGLQHRELALTGLQPNSLYRFNCKAQNARVESPVRSSIIEFLTAP